MEVDLYPYPTSPRSRSMKIRRYGLGADCIIIFGVRKSSATTVCYELLWYPNTYDFARSLALSSHSSLPSAAVVEQSGRRVLPFLDPSAPPIGAAFLFLSLPTGGGESSSSSSLFSWEECVLELSDDESDTTWHRELFRVPLAFFYVFSGTL